MLDYDIVRDRLYTVDDIASGLDAASLVKAIRQRAALTQRELARRAGTTQAVVARIETGRSDPSLRTLQRLAAAGGFHVAHTLRPARVLDPVVDAYKPGVDTTLLIENLRRTPQQRLDAMIAAARTVAEFRRAGRASRLRVAEAAPAYGPDRKSH